MHSSMALTFDEAGIFKDAQVFRDGRNRSVTQYSVRARRSRIRRRVGSDNAPKTASRDGPSKCLTIWLNILPLFIPVQAESDDMDVRARIARERVPTTH